MPTVLVLRADLDRYVDDVLQPATAFGLFNAVMLDIAGAARIPTKQVFAATGSELILTLAPDLIEVKEITVKLAGGTKKDISAYAPAYGMANYDNRTIEWDTALPQTAEFIVRGYRLPVPIIGDADTPEIPAQFHNLLSYGAAVKYLTADDELPSAAAWRTEYNLLLNRLDEFTLDRGTSNAPVMSNPTPIWARR